MSSLSFSKGKPPPTKLLFSQYADYTIIYMTDIFSF